MSSEKWTCLKYYRQANPDGSGNVRLDEVTIGEEGRIVYLRGYGFVRVFRTVSRHRGLRTEIGWYEAKTAIVREAVRRYLRQPTYYLNPTA